jgi:hypothetical protein
MTDAQKDEWSKKGTISFASGQKTGTDVTKTGEELSGMEKKLQRAETGTKLSAEVLGTMAGAGVLSKAGQAIRAARAGEAATRIGRVAAQGAQGVGRFAASQTGAMANPIPAMGRGIMAAGRAAARNPLKTAAAVGLSTGLASNLSPTVYQGLDKVQNYADVAGLVPKIKGFRVGTPIDIASGMADVGQSAVQFAKGNYPEAKRQGIDALQRLTSAGFQSNTLGNLIPSAVARGAADVAAQTGIRFAANTLTEPTQIDMTTPTSPYYNPEKAKEKERIESRPSSAEAVRDIRSGKTQSLTDVLKSKYGNTK